jgi:hypothetical protein
MIPPLFSAALGKAARQVSTRPRFLALGAFLFAGELKADPRLAWVPVDLTLLAASGLALVLLHRWRAGARLASLWAPGLLGLWYLSFLPGLLNLAPTPYAFQKAATLFSFSLLSSLAPFLLLEGEDDLRRLAVSLGWFALVLSLGGLLGWSGEGGGAQRLQAFGAGTIALGRAGGFLFVLAATLLAWGALSPWSGLALMGLGGMAAFFSGSRGPLGASLAALVVALGTARSRPPGMLARAAVSLGLFALLLSSLLALAPPGSLRRVASFVRGEFGDSEAYRLQALQASWPLLAGHPLGLGWGRFATHVDLDKGAGRQYPHNLLMEVGLEGGWPAGFLTCLVLGAASLCAWASTGGPGGCALLAGLLFHGINALVSGDFNDNRPLFAFISAALLWPDLSRRGSP